MCCLCYSTEWLRSLGGLSSSAALLWISLVYRDCAASCGSKMPGKEPGTVVNCHWFLLPQGSPASMQLHLGPLVKGPPLQHRTQAPADTSPGCLAAGRMLWHWAGASPKAQLPGFQGEGASYYLEPFTRHPSIRLAKQTPKLFYVSCKTNKNTCTGAAVICITLSTSTVFLFQVPVWHDGAIP